MVCLYDPDTIGSAQHLISLKLLRGTDLFHRLINHIYSVCMIGEVSDEPFQIVIKVDSQRTPHGYVTSIAH